MTFTYRTQPEGPPDVQQIQKQMAIVAWQPGPNRIVQVPSQVSCSVSEDALSQPGDPHNSWQAVNPIHLGDQPCQD